MKLMRDYFGHQAGDLWESFRDWMNDRGFDLGDAQNEEQADGYLEGWSSFSGPIHPDRMDLMDLDD